MCASRMGQLCLRHVLLSFTERLSLIPLHLNSSYVLWAAMENVPLFSLTDDYYELCQTNGHAHMPHCSKSHWIAQCSQMIQDLFDVCVDQREGSALGQWGRETL